MNRASGSRGTRVVQLVSDKPSLVVLISGSGTNLQALIDATGDGFGLPASCAEHERLYIQPTIVGVVSNRRDASGLVRANRAAHPSRIFLPPPGQTREDHDRRLRDAVDSFKPDWVVLAGYMRVLSMEFLGAYPGKVINLHPALPGELPGTDAIGRAFAEWKLGIRTRSGAMVHLVPDEAVDAGPVLGTVEVPFRDGDTLEVFSIRMHIAERSLLVSVVANLVSASGVSPERAGVPITG